MNTTGISPPLQGDWDLDSIHGSAGQEPLEEGGRKVRPDLWSELQLPWLRATGQATTTESYRTCYHSGELQSSRHGQEAESCTEYYPKLDSKSKTCFKVQHLLKSWGLGKNGFLKGVKL